MAFLNDTTQDQGCAAAVGEIVPDTEAAAIQTITQVLVGKVRDAAQADPPARRDAHAKAHGVVQAEFRVLDNLPPFLSVGVFAEPRVFPAWIRFSNGMETPGPDADRDGRGMAIKLMGVSGSPSTTQDFLMINNPVFFVRDAADYVSFQTNPIAKFFFPGINPLNFRYHEMGVARDIMMQTTLNPLNARYWTMTPYRFGDVACKFSARPRLPLSTFVGTDGPNFLRANMTAQLTDNAAAFDFMVQFRTLPDQMPVEDPTVVWDETASPFIPVATITIPKQVFSTPQQDAFAENLSFTPWHCIDAHRPLGGINRIRRVVYDTISQLRHELNQAPRVEPRDFTI